MKLLPILCIGVVLGASASTVDHNTGIAFESYTSSKGYTFGIAVPESPGSDFIGQLVRFCLFRESRDIFLTTAGNPHHRCRLWRHCTGRADGK
jgi:hypothetical protein